ncbi:hypothetical protein KR51_00033620 [Rubidibacter lacunae KORDI 51-2]|uniref:Uncharacterized protein n=1 Tax=Rubidibacter lacunae KORDI 51-2 TaxID=582515 RepID=U5DFM5_9CHRO|nr:hypothetical protein [Rubidibacter lacunae]ERN40077.1 hypothetical protein KR51_00033620 [Rubidibacter lacunae KORDI 51-2]
MNTKEERTEPQGQYHQRKQRLTVFNPRERDPGRGQFSDRFFASSLTLLSDGDRFFFTREQLAYVLEKRLKSRQFPVFAGTSILASVGTLAVGAAGLLLAFGIFIFTVDRLFWFAIAIAIASCILLNVFYRILRVGIRLSFSPERTNHAVRQGGAAALLLSGSALLLVALLAPALLIKITCGIIGAIGLGSGIWNLRRARLFHQSPDVDATNLAEWLERWQEAGYGCEKLLPPGGNEAIVNLPVHCTRVVICDSPDTAHLLIANGICRDFNCAVIGLSAEELLQPPASVKEAILDLKCMSELSVFVLHDASGNGVKYVPSLCSNLTWFSDTSFIIYDLGLLPRQIFKRGHFTIRKSSAAAESAQRLTETVRKELANSELAWLDAGYHVELASLMPRRLLQIVSQGIKNSAVPSGIAAPIRGGEVRSNQSSGNLSADAFEMNDSVRCDRPEASDGVQSEAPATDELGT